jgi:outer membrane immunogenic protein
LTFGFGSATSTGFTGDGRGEASGALLGAVAGYNMVNGDVVFGGELTLGGARISGREPCANPAWTCVTKSNGIGSLRARLGTLLDPQTMFYGFAGVAASRMDMTTINAANVAFPGKATSRGRVIGLGFERAVGGDSGNMRLRTELGIYSFGPTTYVNDTTYAGVRVDAAVFEIGAIWGF